MNILTQIVNNKILKTKLVHFSHLNRMNSTVAYETLSVSSPKPFVFHVELNRPEKRNAMNNTMWMEIEKCFNNLNDNAECRAIVVSGAGSMFCAGIDLQCFMDLGQSFKENDDVVRKGKALHKHITSYQNSLSSLERCVKPVICAVHGACVGAGVDMITAGDIRYCTNDAWFQVKEIDIGLAADVGTLQRLPKVVRSISLIRELVFTGRKLEAQESKDCGLVNKLFNSKESLIEESINVASVIASKSPVAVQTAKRSLIYSQDRTVEEGLAHIALLNQMMLQSDDLMVAVTASVTRSPDPPVFSKL